MKKTAFVLIGLSIQGRWKGKYVIVGSLKENVLCETIEQAQEYFRRAHDYLITIPNSEVDPDTLQIAEVGFNAENYPTTRINL